MKIAITGSSGFIGKHLINALKTEKYNILEIDTAVGIDLLKVKDLKSIPKFDIIIHLAAKIFVPTSFRNPYDYYFNNYVSTLNILELARKYAAKVIFFRSYLYGKPLYLPIDESHPLNPHNPYAQSKLICEKLCEGYSRDFNVPIVIFRPFNIYGYGQNESFIIPTIINQLMKGKLSLKDPRPKRDYIYIDDVISAILLAIKYEGNTLEIFNLGSGKSYSIYELTKIIIDLSNSDAEVVFTNELREGEVLDTKSDNSKIISEMKWEPLYDLKKGIKKYISLSRTPI